MITKNVDVNPLTTAWVETVSGTPETPIRVWVIARVIKVAFADHGKVPGGIVPKVALHMSPHDLGKARQKQHTGSTAA